jgi:hypothetical protein
LDKSYIVARAGRQGAAKEALQAIIEFIFGIEHDGVVSGASVEVWVTSQNIFAATPVLARLVVEVKTFIWSDQQVEDITMPLIMPSEVCWPSRKYRP